MLFDYIKIITANLLKIALKSFKGNSKKHLTIKISKNELKM